MIELDVIDSETADREDSGPAFWRHWSEAGAEEKEGDDLMEFAPGDSEPPSGASRRQFLQLMGAAMAMAGLAGCRRPEQKILPYSDNPETVTAARSPACGRERSQPAKLSVTRERRARTVTLLAGARWVSRRVSTGFDAANVTDEAFCDRRCRGRYDQRGPKDASR
jgi:hypothetical protein